jgi:hypothetical protein
MDNNEQQGAFPLKGESFGLTKLEYASLMMAQGSISDGQMPQNEAKLAAICVSFAKAVLEEANK